MTQWNIPFRSFFAAVAVCLSGPAAAEILVFAAASLKEPLDEIAADYGGVTVSYEGSGTLARQVMAGAPADVVVLAHVDWIDALLADDAVLPDSVFDIASNALVLAGTGGDVALTPERLEAALGATGRIATGLTASVPAGIYAKQALENMGLWGAVKDRLIEVDNVRLALALAARGEVALAVVYASDLRAAPDLRRVADIPASAHDPIRYIAAVTTAGNVSEAQAFVDYLRGDAAQAILAKAGFLPPPAAQ